MSHVCPDCPLCGHPPKFNLGGQGFCGTDDCRVLSWNLDRTRAENMADSTDSDAL